MMAVYLADDPEELHEACGKAKAGDTVIVTSPKLTVAEIWRSLPEGVQVRFHDGSVYCKRGPSGQPVETKTVPVQLDFEGSRMGFVTDAGEVREGSRPGPVYTVPSGVIGDPLGKVVVDRVVTKPEEMTAPPSQIPDLRVVLRSELPPAYEDFKRVAEGPRRARFYVAARRWEDRQFARDILALCTPLRVEFEFARGGFVIDAEGDCFRPVPEGGELPVVGINERMRWSENNGQLIAFFDGFDTEGPGRVTVDHATDKGNDDAEGPPHPGAE